MLDAGKQLKIEYNVVNKGSLITIRAINVNLSAKMGDPKFQVRGSSAFGARIEAPADRRCREGWSAQSFPEKDFTFSYRSALW
jgi:hypothetical protein